MSNPSTAIWYIVKTASGTCQISPETEVPETADETWGPFETEGEAIARRVGLIRAGKCKPV
jgi:hypothetical protein